MMEEAEALVDVGFLAKLGSREHFDLIAVVGPLGEFLRRPERFGVERLRSFVDMRPFQLGLR